MRIAIACVLLLGCGGKKEERHRDKIDMDEIQTESAVEWAQKQLPELDAKLASTDPGAASSICAVLKPDMKRIEKADPDLFKTVTTRCTHDLPLRELAVAIDKAQAARAADTSPSGFIPECSRVTVDIAGLDKQGLATEAAALVTRGRTVCPK
jgi:hypothetical protein